MSGYHNTNDTNFHKGLLCTYLDTALRALYTSCYHILTESFTKNADEAPGVK